MWLQLKPNATISAGGLSDHSMAVSTGRRSQRRESGFVCTFWELLIAVVIVAVVFGTIIQSYLAVGTREQWTGYSLAAQSMGIQLIEQSRSAVWDMSIGKNEVTNLNLMGWSNNASAMTVTGYTTNILDVPWKGTNYILATNYVTIRTLYENNYSLVPVQLQLVKVNTVWPFIGWKRGQLRYYTNTVITYLAPDNRDPAGLGVN